MVLVSGFESLGRQIWVLLDFVIGGLCNGGFQSMRQWMVMVSRFVVVVVIVGCGSDLVFILFFSCACGYGYVISMAINGCVGGGGGLWRWWLLWFNIFFFGYGV